MKTIFTNGCFDVLHVGHIKLLEYARSLGERLVVGINSDLSVKRLKGQNRPINKEQDRKTVLESLKYVDEVIIFEEDTPLNLIEKIRPDIIVKGGDYTVDRVVGNKISKVMIFKYINGYSTTETIKNISNW